MARQGITREDVFTAASALRDDGIVPTVQLVRDRLGSGSYSTISTHLSAWKAENTTQAAADVPPVPDRVESAFQTLWATATRSAQQSIETDRQALEVMRRELDQERHELRAEIRNLEDALDTMTQEKERIARDLVAERDTLTTLNHQLTALKLENSTLTERTSGLTVRLADMEKDRDRERQLREKAEKQVTTLTTAKTLLEEQLKIAKAASKKKAP